MKLGDFPIFDFSGGIRRDKSAFAMDKNELLNAQNVEIDEQGRVKVRRGSYQIGDTLSGNLENSFVFVRNVGGSTPAVTFIVNNNASTATLSRLRGARLTTAITTASTTVVTSDGNQFAASGTVEIEGDLIAYTGVSTNTLTGVTGITSSHAVGAPIHQWVTLSQSGTAVDGRMGIYYAVLNNILLINGRAANLKLIANDDGTTITDVSSEPSILFATNYRDRIYGAGDASSGTNGDPRRVTFCNRGDPTTWTTASDFFDVEDQRGEPISGFKVLNDRLNIFKPNSIFSYDEIELKQRLFGVGAWNHKVIQEINGIMFTFCPNGIFATNGLEAKSIGDPVKQYWKNFQPVYDSVGNRVVTNTFSGKFEDNYWLYIHDITDPETINDVVLVYNTKVRAWTVFTGSFTDFYHFLSIERFRFGDSATQARAAIFGGDSSGKFYRFFESRYVDSTSTKRGGDVFEDLLSDTGSPVSAVIETPLYDLTQPGLYKPFHDMKVYSEQGGWHVDFRVEDEGKGVTGYKSCGEMFYPIEPLTFPKDTRGYRLGLRFTTTQTTFAPILNGFVIKDTEALNRK
jgi:hypothetical protein